MPETETSPRTPQVGDLLILDARTRRVTWMGNGMVEFDHPDPEADQVRRKKMAAWKARRDAAITAGLAEAVTKGTLIPTNAALQAAAAQIDTEYRTKEAPPEMSRAGACAARDLMWMDGLNCWAVRGRIEGRKLNLGAVQLSPADARALAAPAPAQEG